MEFKIGDIVIYDEPGFLDWKQIFIHKGTKKTYNDRNLSTLEVINTFTDNNGNIITKGNEVKLHTEWLKLYKKPKNHLPTWF